jgi:hypothetical protein
MSKISGITKVSLPAKTMQGHALPNPGPGARQQLGQASSPDDGSHLPSAARGELSEFPAQRAEILRVARTK